MKASEIFCNKDIPNKKKFGVYVRERRLELGMSLRYMSALLEMAPVYLHDIEYGNRPAPTNFMDNIIKVLKVEEDELNFVYDLAGCTRGNHPDLDEFFDENPNLRKALRLAKEKKISDEELTNLILNLKVEQSEEDLIQ